MVISKIEIQKNNKEKVNIFVDGEYSFSLSLKGVNKYGLYNGRNISENEIKEIKDEDEKELAFLFLLDKISYKMFTEKEIRDKLIKKGFEIDSINYSLEKAKEYGYINDSYYAKCFIEQRGIPNKWGQQVIYQKLFQKGIDKNIIKESLNEFFDEEDEKENCYLLACKKMNSIKDFDFDNRNFIDKMYRFLISKGYSYETINSTIEKLKKEISC